MNASLQLSGNLNICISKYLYQELAFSVKILGANLTSKFTVVDLHIDQGKDGLIQYMGKYRKIVFM
jgi:hypothetical protein